MKKSGYIKLLLVTGLATTFSQMQAGPVKATKPQEIESNKVFDSFPARNDSTGRRYKYHSSGYINYTMFHFYCHGRTQNGSNPMCKDLHPVVSGGGISRGGFGHSAIGTGG